MGFEEERAERDFRMNPPSDAPAQGASMGWDDLPSGSSSAESLADNYSSDINQTLNDPFGRPQGSTPGMPPTMGNQQGIDTSMEDKVINATVVSAKGFYKYVKLMVESFNGYGYRDWIDFAKIWCTLGACCFVAGILLFFIELVRKSGNDVLAFVVGSAFSIITGLFVMMTCRDKLDKYGEKEKKEEVKEETFENFDTMSEEEGNDWAGEYEEENEESYTEFEETFKEEEYEEDSWGNVEYEEDDYEPDDSGTVNSENFDADESVNELQEIDPGTYTRQYLYEAYTKVLPLISPGYSEMQEIYDSSDDFYEFENYLRAAAEQSGLKEENLPELISLKENPFIYRLTCTRPVGMKEQIVADEIAKTYSRDEDNMLYKYGVYATVETSTNACSINLFKGYELNALNEQIGGVVISLGDVYRQISEFVSSTKVEMPFVWGINEVGRALYCDLKDTNSIIICGDPRGGKSWKGQSILSQLAMFHSPEELYFFVFDNKGLASDYYYPSTVLPHVKYFCGDPSKIVEGLEKVITYATETNGEVMSKAKKLNIKDYNKSNPLNKLPYMYVVIDELQALMNYYKEYDLKDEANKFKAHLSTITSKLPYLGLRLILFPHRIVDQIISKDTYALVSARAVVNQLDADLVKQSVGVSESKFKYKLAQKGDMALRIKELNGGEACFCHAEVLSRDNDSNKNLFSYIGAVWNKLCPDIKCIEIGSNLIGGSIRTKGSGSCKVSLSKDVERKPAPDNTNGVSLYKYNGFDNMADGSGVSDISEDLEISAKDDNEESFWDKLMED